MYVIFPADEVVYLSYGRLIYVPYAPTPDNRLNTPIRTLQEEDVDNIPVTPPPGSNPASSSRKTSSESSTNNTSKPSDRPGPSGVNSLERSKRSVKGKQQQQPQTPTQLESRYQGSLERPGRIRVAKTPERAYTTNSNKSSKSSKQSSSSSKSRSQPGTSKEKLVQESSPIRHRTASESATTHPKQSKSTSKLSSSSFRDFWKPKSKQDSSNNKPPPDTPPLRPERKKEKKQPPPGKLAERQLSYSDYLSVSRERTEIPRSDIINTRSDQGENVPSAFRHSVVKREKSPVLRFFRAQSSSPRNLPRDKSAFNFDLAAVADNNHPSPGKLSVNSTPAPRPLRPGVSSDSNLVAGRGAAGALSEKSPTKRRGFFSSLRLKKPTHHEETTTTTTKMAVNESPLRDLIHPAYNEHLKSHNAVTFKLVRTVSDFTQQLGQMYEQHAGELQMLVANFRKRNSELRKERPACPSSLFHTWETLLQEVEIDSQALGDIASILSRQVSRPLLEKSFHRKIQSRKVFTHRESYETIIAKTEEKLAKCRQEYKNAYLSYLSAPSTESLSAYFNSHNAYIQQLHATNGMMEEFGKNTLPSLLHELEEIYTDLCSTVTESVLQGAEVVSNRAMEQCRRYEALVSQCRAVSGPADLTHLARALPAPQGRGPIMKRIFVPPQPPPPVDMVDGGGEQPELQANDGNIPPPLKDELVIDKLSAVQIKPSHDVLKKESQDLEGQIRQIQDALDTLLRIQQRSVEASLFNKANELQEDISMKRFDLRVAQIHLAAINSQKELFSSKLEGETVSRERKMSAASTGSMKNKWLKAFKSLKTPPPEPEKKNGAAATRELLKGDPDAHNFQEYTYKKITPCDVCSQVLRGHTRQGLKCRICKMNVHADCQNKASKCQTKARLLRRQKSTSEIETRVPEATSATAVDDERVAEVYSMPTINRRISIRNNNTLYPPPNAVLDHRQGPSSNNSATESSSMRRRLFAGMKSLTGFGSRSRHGSPGHRSISLPEKRNSQDASGTRPFGQPLCLGPQFENGNGVHVPKSSSPTPSKGKLSPVAKKGSKSKK